MAGTDASEPTIEQALARAQRHGRAAVVEALEALHALLDVAAIATGGVPAEAHGVLASAAQLLTLMRHSVETAEDPRLQPLLNTLAEVLDGEISRWEELARDDSQARAVLRAFLGLRELLWELGMRPTSPRKEPAPKRPRVQRVRVQG